MTEQAKDQAVIMYKLARRTTRLLFVIGILFTLAAIAFLLGGHLWKGAAIAATVLTVIANIAVAFGIYSQNILESVHYQIVLEVMKIEAQERKDEMIRKRRVQDMCGEKEDSETAGK